MCYSTTDRRPFGYDDMMHMVEALEANGVDASMGPFFKNIHIVRGVGKWQHLTVCSPSKKNFLKAVESVTSSTAPVDVHQYGSSPRGFHAWVKCQALALRLRRLFEQGNVSDDGFVSAPLISRWVVLDFLAVSNGFVNVETIMHYMALNRESAEAVLAAMIEENIVRLVGNGVYEDTGKIISLQAA
jgi:hypothetical protein